MRCHRVLSAVLGAVQSNVTSAEEFAITSTGKASVPLGIVSDTYVSRPCGSAVPTICLRWLRISFQRALGRGTFPWLCIGSGLAAGVTGAQLVLEDLKRLLRDTDWPISYPLFLPIVLLPQSLLLPLLVLMSAGHFLFHVSSARRCVSE